MASQIEIDGQDYGEKDDGSEDEDQDTILDDPAEKEREKKKKGERWREKAGIRQGSQKSYHVCREKFKARKTVTFMWKLNDQVSTEAYQV